MKCLWMLLMVTATGHGAMQRSPVYPAHKPSSVTTAKPSVLPEMVTSVPVKPSSGIAAQAREGIAPEAPQGTPAQNYMVYFYPDQQYRNVPVQQNSVQGYQTSEAGYFSSLQAYDYACILGTIVLLAGGTGLIYAGLGSQVRARALRELKEISYEDASNLARRVLRAIEKFQNMNTVASE